MSTFTQQITVRGRGARSNASGRFESQAREAFDDGWTLEDAEPQQLKTTLTAEKAKTIISKNTSPDVGFSRSINPYRGCEHGCIYCYARPAHAYMGLSPGLDFESQLFFKPEAGKLLERELSAPRYEPQFIHIGGNTDPYQPQERTARVTRQVLEVLERFNHPFSIITKSALILRDIDTGGDGEQEPVPSGDLGDDAGSQARPQHGAARGHARTPDRGDQGAGGRRRSGDGDVRAGHSGPERP